MECFLLVNEREQRNANNGANAAAWAALNPSYSRSSSAPL